MYITHESDRYRIMFVNNDVILHV